MTRAFTSFLLIALLAVACQGAVNANLGPDIIIASDLPTTSSLSSLPLQQAIEFAIRRQPSIEGYRLAYWPLDNALGGIHSQLRGRENVRRMIADQKVLGMVGPESSFVAYVEMPEANRAHLAMVSPITTNSCLTVANPYCQTPLANLRPTGKINFFRITPRDPLQGRAMADYIATNLGPRHVAAFNEFGPQGMLYIKEFSDEMTKHGGLLVYQENLDDSTVDFSAFLSQAKAHGADAVYGLAAVEQHACLAAAQMSQSMPDAIFLATDGITGQGECIQEMGPTPPRVWATLPSVDPMTGANPVDRKTVADFLKAYPQGSSFTAVTPYTFAAYDCARILIDAIGRAIRDDGGTLPTRPQVLTAVAQTKDFQGVTGTYSFDGNGDAISPMMSIYQVHAGRWEFVQIYKFSAA